MQARWRKASTQNNGLCKHFCLGDCPSSSCPEIRQFSFFSVCHWHLLSCWHSAISQSERVCQWASPCMGPLRVMPGTPAAFCLSQLQSLLIFTARVVFTSSTGELDVGLGPLTLQGGPPQPRYPSQFLNTTHGYGTRPFCVSTPPCSYLCISSVIRLLLS